MTKSLSYRLFRFGSIPKNLRAALEQEEIIVLDEGIPGKFITKNVKGPGKRYLNRIEAFSGFLVVTKRRVTCFSYRRRQINISVSDPKISHLNVDCLSGNVLSISFESSMFRQGWEGVIEFRFTTQKAHQFYEALTAIGARHPMASGCQEKNLDPLIGKGVNGTQHLPL